MSEVNTVLKYEGKFSTGGFQSTKWKTVTAHFMQEGTGRRTIGFTLHVKPTSNSMKRDQAVTSEYRCTLTHISKIGSLPNPIQEKIPMPLILEEKKKQRPGVLNGILSALQGPSSGSRV